MWSVGSEPAKVYLGLGTVGVWVPGTLPDETRWESVTSPNEGWLRALALLSELEPKPRGRRVALSLSGALARPFMFEPVQGLRRWSEAVQIAAGLAPEATGLDGICEIWMDDWSPQRPCLAIAFDKGLRADIERTAKEQGVGLRSLQPWWTCALNEAVRSSSKDLRLLAVEEPDAMTLICGSDGQFRSVASFAPKPEPSQIGALLTRALLAANATAVQGVRAALSIGVVTGLLDTPTVPQRPFAPRLEHLA